MLISHDATAQGFTIIEAVLDGKEVAELARTLEPLGVSQVEAAKRMNIPIQRLNAIVRGRRGVSADTALLFEALTRWDADLADAPGQVGSVACAEATGASAEGACPSQERVTSWLPP
jgi:predicted transcriptional regulator